MCSLVVPSNSLMLGSMEVGHLYFCPLSEESNYKHGKNYFSNLIPYYVLILGSKYVDRISTLYCTVQCTLAISAAGGVLRVAARRQSSDKKATR